MRRHCQFGMNPVVTTLMQHSGVSQPMLYVEETRTCDIGNTNNCDISYSDGATMGNIDNEVDHDGLNAPLTTNHIARVYRHPANRNREQLGAYNECQTTFLSPSTIGLDEEHNTVLYKDHQMWADSVAKENLMYAERKQQMAAYPNHTGTMNRLLVETNEHVGKRAEKQGFSLLSGTIDNSVSTDVRVNAVHNAAHGDYTEPFRTVEKDRTDYTYPHPDRYEISSKSRSRTTSRPNIGEHEDFAVLSYIVEWKLRGLQKCVKYLRQNQMYYARSILLQMSRERRQIVRSKGCRPDMAAYEVNGDDAFQELDTRQKDNIRSSWKRARETVTSKLDFVEHNYLNTNDSLTAKYVVHDQMHCGCQVETTHEQVTATSPNKTMKRPTSQTLLTKHNDQIRETLKQITEADDRRSSIGEDTFQRIHNLCNVHTFQIKSAWTTKPVDSRNTSQNANDNSVNFADKEERAPVFRSTWSPAIGTHRPMKHTYVPHGVPMAPSMYPETARENITIPNEEYRTVSDSVFVMPSGGLTQNERSHFIQDLEQMSNRLFQNSPAMKQAHMQHIQSPHATMQTRMGYIEPPRLATPAKTGYPQQPSRLSQAYIPPIHEANIQPPRLITPPEMGYTRPPPRLSQAYIPPKHDATRRPTQQFEACSSFDPEYQLASESPSPLYSQERSYISSSSSESVTAERRRSSTAQIVSDTLKGAEYNVMYMCDPKNPDIIQKLAIIPNHCLHDHDVCVRRIKQAERPTKRRTSSTDDDADSRRRPSPTRYTQQESDKRRKKPIPKTITLTDRFGVKRRLRLKRRRQGATFLVSKMRRNTESPHIRGNTRQSEFTPYYPRGIHKDDYTNPREVDPWIDVHPSRVHSDEHARPQRARSEESLRAHQLRYDDDIRQQKVTDDSRRRHQIRTGTTTRSRRVTSNRHGYPQTALSDENVVPGLTAFRPEKFSDDARMDDDRISSQSDTRDESDTDNRDARRTKHTLKKDKALKKYKTLKKEMAVKKENMKKGWKKKKKKLVSRHMFPAPGNADEHEGIPPHGRSSYEDQPGYDSEQCDNNWSDVWHGAVIPAMWRARARRRISTPRTKPAGTSGKASKSRRRGKEIRKGRKPHSKDKSKQSQTGFQVSSTDTRRHSAEAEGRQPHTGGTTIRWGSKVYDNQTVLLPNVSPRLRSEENRRRTSQYVHDVSQIPISVSQTEPVAHAVRGDYDDVDKKRKGKKKHHKDKQSKKESKKHTHFDQLDTSNLVPRTYPEVPTMNVQSPSDVSVGKINEEGASIEENTDARKRKSKKKARKNVSENVEIKRVMRKSELPAKGDDEDVEFEAEANALQFWVGQVARKSLEDDKRKLKDIGQVRSAQQRSNNNVGNSYTMFTVPCDAIVTSHDDQPRHLWSDQDEGTTDDVRTMGQERFRMIRDSFETGTFVSTLRDYVDPH